MASMMDKLIEEVTDNVMLSIKTKLLPAIADRYNIDHDELLDLINNEAVKEVKTTSIKATPKKASKKTSKCLEDKIADAKAQGSFFNVSTGRPLKDNARNRGKYMFVDKLNIAGTKGEDKFNDALRQLGAPEKKEEPVHVQAAKAKAKRMEGSSSSDDESESLTDIPEPKVKAIKKPIRRIESDTEEEESDKPVKKPESEDDEEESDKPVKKVSVKKATSEDDEEESDKPVKKPESEDEEEESDKPVKKVSVKKATSEDDEEESDKPVEKKPESEDDEESVLKLSELVDMKDLPRKPKLAYNTTLKTWWNPDTGYVFRKKGIKNTVINKVVDDEITDLTQADIERCKKAGWLVKE